MLTANCNAGIKTSVSIKKKNFETYLKQYTQQPSIRNCHLVARAVIDCIQWKINFECRNDNLFTHDDISHELYLFCFNLIKNNNYETPQHLLNKTTFKIKFARANFFKKDCLSIYEHSGILDNLAYVLQQSLPNYSEPLCQKAFELITNDKTQTLIQYAKGYHPKEIAKQLILEESMVKDIINDARLQIQLLANWQPKKRNLDDFSSRIKPLFDKGIALKIIATKLEVSYKKVRGTVLRNGWTRAAIR